MSGSILDGVPVFPLPAMTLFPGQLLPLHIFEPRYRAMARDALNGDQKLVLAQIDGQELLDDGRPRIHCVAGLGAIAHHRELEDGRFLLLLEGRGRVRVRERAFEPPYRQADVMLLQSSAGEKNSPTARALESTARRAIELSPYVHPELEAELPTAATPGALADACAHHLVASAKARQALLEELNEDRRVDACLEALLVELPANQSEAN